MTGDVVKAMRACPQPIVAAIDGVCAGAGAILAMASDLRLGTERSRVAFLFVRVGLGGCDMGACAMLPRIVGLGRASELLYTGRSLPGAQAYDWGFYNELSSPDALPARARELAATIAAGPALAHAMTKKMLSHEWALPLEEAIDAEAAVQATLMDSGDFRRAYEAFVAKRSPRFEGN
jgi:enoyl-CoA hydratase/carnithine racemase